MVELAHDRGKEIKAPEGLSSNWLSWLAEGRQA